MTSSGGSFLAFFGVLECLFLESKLEGDQPLYLKKRVMLFSMEAKPVEPVVLGKLEKIPKRSFRPFN